MAPAAANGAAGLLLYLFALLFVDLQRRKHLQRRYSPAPNWDLTADDLASPIRRIVF